MKLTPKQAAAHAGVSPQLIYQWTTVEHRLPHFRCGGRGKRGRILIDEADLTAFLATLKVTPTPAADGLVHIRGPARPPA